MHCPPQEKKGGSGREARWVWDGYETGKGWVKDSYWTGEGVGGRRRARDR